MKQDFTANAPFTKLLTDISQITCADGTLYISPIMDYYSGEILSLQLRDNMKKELCIDALKTAVQRFHLGGNILHIGRGSQYTSHEFKNKLSTTGMRQNLSGVDHCYDNA